MTATLTCPDTTTASLFTLVETLGVSALVQPAPSGTDYTHTVTVFHVADARAVAAVLLIAHQVPALAIDGGVVSVRMLP